MNIDEQVFISLPAGNFHWVSVSLYAPVCCLLNHGFRTLWMQACVLDRKKRYWDLVTKKLWKGINN